ncbi:protein MTSS 1-like isoform X1 [Hemibagrus wyckioides]|uniref:protein MTSS 1-like isoform X1 n=1 Tax=Hemibagrus wyckioides TaxID=337641 RepID=UPI00266D672D|nr:protein MTSS 1-like isoform X1 [Hemibagrus wyckioides]
MEAVMERECSALGGLFQTVITDMKGSYPVWEDFISKAGKLQAQLRATVVAVAAFLDAFQKVADLATGSRGATRDIGSALTRMCMRHRSIEAKLRQFSMVFVDSLINPLQEQMEEWKRVANTMDKDHAKEYKRARQEIKKKSSDTLKLQKKAKKGRGDLQPQVDSALQGVSDKYASLQETERQAVRKALIEERARFCTFVSMLRPAIEEEVCMLGEITHLQSISDDLRSLTMDPHKLPPSSEQVIADLKGSECSWSYQTPPSSPSTTSRKSSMCSSLNSVNSSDSRSSSSHSHSPTSHFRYRGSALPQQGSVRLPSVSSHDSGFTSQDTCQSKSPSPMPPDGSVQCPDSSCPDESAQPITDSRTPTLPDSNTNTEDKLVNGTMSQFNSVDPSLFIVPSSPPFSSHPPSPSWAWSQPGPAPGVDFEPSFPLGPGTFPPSHRVPSWKDWARPGPYDQPMVNTLRRVRERVRENSECSSSRDEAHKASPNSSTHTKPRDDAHEELAVCLSRGLSLDIPRSSRESVQGSSGYSTQTNTPCCSEDTYIFDYECLPGGGDQDGESQDCDGPAPLLPSADISHSYRRTLPAKRPSPCGPVSITPGVATIRRAPTSKPSLWRGPSVHGPIPIKTPVIPVKTPTVPAPLCSEDAESPGDPSPSPTQLTPNSGSQSEGPAEQDQVGPDEQEGSMLSSIRRGVSLKKATTNDRSAPVLE